MRLSGKIIYQNFNRIRKQNWSAPAVMSVFILICMICIFSFESIGLLNNARNINYRLSPSSELKIKLFMEEGSNAKKTHLLHKKVEITSIENEHLKSHALKEKLNAVNDILFDAAKAQLSYELETSMRKEYGNLSNEVLESLKELSFSDF